MTYSTPQTMRAAQTQRLIQLASMQTDSVSRWDFLCAAHIVGQHEIRLHLHTHLAMLRLAWIEKQACELLGQLLRLALAPIGHALGKLPAGNSGRSTEHALRSMPVSAKLEAIIQSVSPS